jgi:hypothetical protein
MAEQMTIEDVTRQEKLNSGTSKTNNIEFDKSGYFVVRNLWDPQELYRPVPAQRGQISYWGKRDDQFTYQPLEQQVEGSLAVYSHPQYRSIQSGIRLKLEKIIGNQLYNTYYYDRYYFPGQALTIHCDRPACEISVTVNISTNLEKCWPVCIKKPSGEIGSVCLSPGDGMIYKGCERPHWRDPMPTEYNKTWYGKKVEKEGLYYHQVFFHYVLANGIRSHFAGDYTR